MRARLLACAIALAACSGHRPNTLRFDLPVAGEPNGGPVSEDGFALAFCDTLLHVVSASGPRIGLVSTREDGRDEGSKVLLEVPDGAWSLPVDAQWEGGEAFAACLAAGPRKEERSIRIDPGGLSRSGDGWALAFTAVLTLSCQTPEKVERRSAFLDHLVLFSSDWSVTEGPTPVRCGTDARTLAVLSIGGSPAIAFHGREGTGIATSSRTWPVPVEADLLFDPLLVPASDGIAIVTATASSIRVRLTGADPSTVDLDVSITPPRRPLSVAAAWTGDRLGVFFAADRTETTGTILEHVLVEIGPGLVSKPAKVYAQYGTIEDATYTRKLTAVFEDGLYALAWIADDGYSQDLYLQEVPLGGVVVDKKAWRMDMGEGYRAFKSVRLFSTPPQYVLAWTTPSDRRFILTSLPTDR